MKFLIITGMSGAGKSQAANALEDLGYYCIDNMPAVMIPKFAELYVNTPGKYADVAFIIDVRGEINFDVLLDEVDNLKEKGYECQTLFLDCDTNVLLNRYKITRRIHPLINNRSIPLNEAFALERQLLETTKSRADYVIDTTKLTAKQLKDRVTGLFGEQRKGIFVICTSFGFKQGITVDADTVVDVRCFRNPYYVSELKDLTGLDEPVRDYVMNTEEVKVYLEKLYDMLDYMLPMYVKEGKSQFTIGIGCTGGHHRSVVIAEELGRHLKENGYDVLVLHRDIEK